MISVSTAVEKLAYAPRVENWKKLEIMPGGAKSEVFDAMVKSSTNLSSDAVNMLLNFFFNLNKLSPNKKYLHY